MASKLREEYEKQKAAMELHRAAVYAVLERMIEAGEAKRLDDVPEGCPEIIVSENRELMDRVVSLDYDGDYWQLFDKDHEEIDYTYKELEFW